MKKFLLAFFILLSCISSHAEFGIRASAIYMNVNGTAAFYNTQIPAQGSIGNNIFSGSIGVFGKNSGTLKVLGAEIKTYRENSASICNSSLYYLLYERGNRPAAPIFKTINLGLYCNCNNGSFSSCGGGTCSGSDQKWENVNQGIDLTSLALGNYTLEVYYQVSGEITGNTCSQKRFDNASGSNYKVDFSIIAPLALNFYGFTGNCSANSIKLKWTMENDVEVEKYEIQKSNNGLSFFPAGSIMSSHASTSYSYVFNDLEPIIGTNYYRVKIYNANGSINLSNAMRIYFGQVSNTLFIYPNPTSNELTIRLAAVNKGNYQLSIFSTDGQRIATTPVVHDGIDKTLKIVLPLTIAKGLYRLFLIDKRQFYKQAFMIR